MTTMGLQTGGSPLADTELLRAIEKLVVPTEVAGGCLISLPLAYATGTSVGVRIEAGVGGFIVSDFAMGYREAEDFGAQRSFARNVRKAIEGSPIEFTTGRQIRMLARPEQLRGAIIKIASLSRDAVQKAYEAASDWDDEELGADLFQRLAGVFGTDHVIARALKTGASSVQWKFAAKVVFGQREIMFDAVSPSHMSVFAAVSKFNDVSRLDNPVSAVAVVDSKKAMGKWLPLISQAATVIEDDASEDTLRGLVRNVA